MQALITARISREYQKLGRSTAAIVFSGCPFGGSDCATIVDKCTALIGNRQGILQCLKPGSPQLYTLQHDFRNAYPNLPVSCFFEKIKSARSVLVRDSVKPPDVCYR